MSRESSIFHYFPITACLKSRKCRQFSALGLARVSLGSFYTAIVCVLLLADDSHKLPVLRPAQSVVTDRLSPVSKGSRINVKFCGFMERAMGIEPRPSLSTAPLFSIEL